MAEGLAPLLRPVTPAGKLPVKFRSPAGVADYCDVDDSPQVRVALTRIPLPIFTRPKIKAHLLAAEARRTISSLHFPLTEAPAPSPPPTLPISTPIIVRPPLLAEPKALDAPIPLPTSTTPTAPLITAAAALAISTAPANAIPILAAPPKGKGRIRLIAFKETEQCQNSSPETFKSDVKRHVLEQYRAHFGGDYDLTTLLSPPRRGGGTALPSPSTERSGATATTTRSTEQSEADSGDSSDEEQGDYISHHYRGIPYRPYGHDAVYACDDQKPRLLSRWNIESPDDEHPHCRSPDPLLSTDDDSSASRKVQDLRPHFRPPDPILHTDDDSSASREVQDLRPHCLPPGPPGALKTHPTHPPANLRKLSLEDSSALKAGLIFEFKALPLFIQGGSGSTFCNSAIGTSTPPFLPIRSPSPPPPPGKPFPSPGDINPGPTFADSDGEFIRETNMGSSRARFALAHRLDSRHA